MNIQHNTQVQKPSNAGSDFLPNLAFNKSDKMIPPHLLKNLVVCEKPYSRNPLVNFFQHLFSIGSDKTYHLNALGYKALLNSETPTLTPDKPTYLTYGVITAESINFDVEQASFENQIKLAQDSRVDAKSLKELKNEADLEKIQLKSFHLENSLAKNPQIINAVKSLFENGEIEIRNEELQS